MWISSSNHQPKIFMSEYKSVRAQILEYPRFISGGKLFPVAAWFKLLIHVLWYLELLFYIGPLRDIDPTPICMRQNITWIRQC